MIGLALIGILIGMAVGLRYRVMALLPIEMAGLGVLFVALFLASPGTAVLHFVVWSCALQFGYLATALIGWRERAVSRALASQH